MHACRQTDQFMRPPHFACSSTYRRVCACVCVHYVCVWACDRPLGHATELTSLLVAGLWQDGVSGDARPCAAAASIRWRGRAWLGVAALPRRASPAEGARGAGVALGRVPPKPDLHIALGVVVAVRGATYRALLRHGLLGELRGRAKASAGSRRRAHGPGRASRAGPATLLLGGGLGCRVASAGLLAVRPSVSSFVAGGAWRAFRGRLHCNAVRRRTRGD